MNTGKDFQNRQLLSYLSVLDSNAGKKSLNELIYEEWLSMQKSLGQIAFEAYCEHQNWIAYNGEPIPDWDSAKPGVQEAWAAAADAVIENMQKY